MNWFSCCQIVLCGPIGVVVTKPFDGLLNVNARSKYKYTSNGYFKLRLNKEYNKICAIIFFVDFINIQTKKK